MVDMCAADLCGSHHARAHTQDMNPLIKTLKSITSSKKLKSTE